MVLGPHLLLCASSMWLDHLQPSTFVLEAKALEPVNTLKEVSNKKARLQEERKNSRHEQEDGSKCLFSKDRPNIRRQVS
ncbi:hypothetical protein AKJ16_DCAP14511 [Drosera capensis]